jgi:hypothetical protein
MPNTSFALEFRRKALEKSLHEELSTAGYGEIPAIIEAEIKKITVQANP